MNVSVFAIPSAPMLAKDAFVKRLQQFARNARMMGVLQTLAVFGLFAYSISQMTTWSERAPFIAIILAGFAVGFVLRGTLVEHIEVTGPVLQVVAYCLIGCSILLMKRLLPDVPGLPFALICLTAIYMGCYFWVMSDSQITRMD